MRAILYLLMLPLAGLVNGCDDSNATDAPQCIPALAPIELVDARLTIDAQGRLRDGLGREVVLRGLNTGGRSKFEPFLPFDITADATLDEVRTAADLFYARLRDWGLDTVRMPFSWEALEPAPGVIDERYLDRYEAMIDTAWARDLRVIVDFHQDIYASPFCGDGFPPWTIEDLAPEPPRHDCPTWFMSYFNDADVHEAFDRFWLDEGGVQTAFRHMWRLMAERFADHPGVVGFEVINEPHFGTAPDPDVWKQEVLAPFYETLRDDLRAIAPEVLVFYDSTGTDAPRLSESQHPRPAGNGLVYAPHYYDGTLLMGVGWAGEQPEPHVEAVARFRDQQGVPVLIGEFGYPDGTDRGDLWLSLLLDSLDTYGISATLWDYSQSTELWNEENLSVVNADGSDRAILDTYVRPRLRALAGSDASLTWNGETGETRASWRAAEGVTEIVVPRRRFPRGPQRLTLSGTSACHTWDSARGELRVMAPPDTELTLSFFDR